MIRVRVCIIYCPMEYTKGERTDESGSPSRCYKNTTYMQKLRFAQNVRRDNEIKKDWVG